MAPHLRYELLDGRNRLDAMEAAGLLANGYKTTNIETMLEYWRVPATLVQPPTDPRAYVLSANIRRRHLPPEDKDRLIAELIKLNPTRSSRQIAKDAGVSHTKVSEERKKLEQSGDVATGLHVVDTKGRKQPTGRQRTDRRNDDQRRKMKSAPPGGTPSPRKPPSPLAGVYELIVSAEAYYKSRGAVDESKVVAHVIQAATKEQLEAIVGNPRFGGAYKTAAGARLGATQHAETPQPAPSAASMSPEETMARDLDRMVKTLDAFAGLIPHVSPRQFADRADDDVMANAKEVTAWLTQLADLSSSAPDRVRERGAILRRPVHC